MKLLEEKLKKEFIIEKDSQLLLLNNKEDVLKNVEKEKIKKNFKNINKIKFPVLLLDQDRKTLFDKKATYEEIYKAMKKQFKKKGG